MFVEFVKFFRLMPIVMPPRPLLSGLWLRRLKVKIARRMLMKLNSSMRCCNVLPVMALFLFLLLICNMQQRDGWVRGVRYNKSLSWTENVKYMCSKVYFLSATAVTEEYGIAHTMVIKVLNIFRQQLIFNGYLWGLWGETFQVASFLIKSLHLIVLILVYTLQ